jgi:RNA polymerase sigma-70 factor, ECF subfamily
MTTPGKGPVAKEHHPPADEELIARAQAGDQLAFEGLVERYQAQVARIVGRKVPWQDAPEVAQEVFIKAFVSLPNYRPLKPLGHWLSTLAVRACHDYWRAHYRRREVPLSALATEAGRQREPVDAVAAQDPYAAYEAWELLDWALGHLSPEDRMAVTLVHLEGWTLAEAAEALGWSQTVVKLRNFRARRKLHQLISQTLAGEVEDEKPRA